MPEFVKVMEVTDLPPGQCTAVDVNGIAVAIFNVDGSFYAIDHFCPHQGGPLGEGWLEGELVMCPWHAWQFNVRTGESTFVPGFGVRTFQVLVEGNDVKIGVE
jgi:3-phenylpropionate/trans-cinnamate dioxygenase ferredoxin component